MMVWDGERGWQRRNASSNASKSSNPPMSNALQREQLVGAFEQGVEGCVAEFMDSPTAVVGR